MYREFYVSVMRALGSLGHPVPSFGLYSAGVQFCPTKMHLPRPSGPRGEPLQCSWTSESDEIWVSRTVAWAGGTHEPPWNHLCDQTGSRQRDLKISKVKRHLQGEGVVGGRKKDMKGGGTSGARGGGDVLGREARAGSPPASQRHRSLRLDRTSFHFGIIHQSGKFVIMLYKSFRHGTDMNPNAPYRYVKFHRGKEKPPLSTIGLSWDGRWAP